MGVRRCLRSGLALVSSRTALRCSALALNARVEVGVPLSESTKETPPLLSESEWRSCVFHCLLPSPQHLVYRLAARENHKSLDARVSQCPDCTVQYRTVRIQLSAHVQRRAVRRECLYAARRGHATCARCQLASSSKAPPEL